MTTTESWDHFWAGFVIIFFITFLLFEFGSILYRKKKYGTQVCEWTFSDFIRRWMLAHHWAPALAVGALAWFTYHIFFMANS